MESKETIRCKLKYGNAEFEIEGLANSELTKKVDSLYEMFTEAVASEKGVTETHTGANLRRRGGGRRPPFIKSAILNIIEREPEWFVDKCPEDVTDKLKTSYGVPGAKVKPVGTALIRLFADGELTRKEVGAKYLYSITALKRE
jgi:hypothetical protein